VRAGRCAEEEAGLEQSGKLEGKVAVVTGAGSQGGDGYGIGKAISILLAREDAKVLLVDQFEDRARETLDEVQSEGGDGAIFVADLAQPDSAQKVVDEAVSRFGRLDILVNNAAISATVSLLDTTRELYDKVIAVNLTAPFFLSQAAIPAMAADGGGSIVHITSIAAVRGTGGSGQAAYAAAKSGLFGLMIDNADVYGRQGIRINCVSPGIVDTPMRQAAMRQVGLEPGSIDLSEKTSVGFEGDAWDIARAVLFLAGPDGRYVTGHHIPIDGGTTARSH
jgi:NAD(P)-dependent dehydrogenase (short-subunit alcohol dehydrogenase family)